MPLTAVRPVARRPRALRATVAAATLAGALALAGCVGEPAAQPSPAAPLTTPPPAAGTGTPTLPPADVPGAATTGVPDGVTLEPSDALTIDEDGAVVENLDIDGCVVVAADDVTIRASRITCTDTDRAVVMDGDRTGLVLEDVEIDGGGTTDIGVDVSNVVLRRLDIHHVNDGVRMGGNVTVEDSWIHDLSRSGELHPDAIQGISAQHIVIRGNHLDPRDPESGDNGNAAIMLGSETGTMLSKDVVIEGNYLNGGNYSINIRQDINAEGFVVRDNRFGPDARYGPILTRSTVQIGEGNVMELTGAPAEPDLRDE